MILSKKTREGYLLLDHTASPGVPGLPAYFEAATIKCKHCEKILIRNPARTRERAYCPSCDRYICDECEVVRRIEGCKTFDEKIDQHLKTASNLGVI